MRKKRLGSLLSVTLIVTLLGFPYVGKETKEPLFSAWLYAQTQSPSPPGYDLIIRGGKLIDGTGNPWFYGDVAIRGERIAKVGRVGETAQRIIDAKGLVVSPGFIDMHSHSDITLPIDGNAESKIRQGVTTEIVGEHFSMAPLCSAARRTTVIGVPQKPCSVARLVGCPATWLS